jgi:hypothetical protein
MAAEWYYTTNKQQMGPVSWEELCQLASKALLKPDDLVWTEGMPEWVKAVRQQGLFQDSAAPAASVTAPRAETPVAAPRTSSARQRIDEELDEIDDEQRRQRRKTRKGSGSGLKIGLIIGLVVCVVLLISCGLIITVIVVLFSDRGGPGGMPAAGGGIAIPANYTVNLGQGGLDNRVVTLRAGQRIALTVRTDRAGGAAQPTTVVQIIQGGHVHSTAQGNVAVNNMGFTAPANGSYIIRVQNRGPGNSRVTVDVR